VYNGGSPIQYRVKIELNNFVVGVVAWLVNANLMTEWLFFSPSRLVFLFLFDENVSKRGPPEDADSGVATSN